MTFLSIALFACVFAAVLGGAWGGVALFIEYPASFLPLRVRAWRTATRAAHWYAWLVLRVYAFSRPKRRICAPDGTHLITRWFLTSHPEGDSTGTPGWYLHRLENADTSREEHSHPWAEARTRVLRGFYIETRNGRARTHVAGDTDTIRPDEYHRITLIRRKLGPTWTLFYAGPKHGRGWGFR